MAEGAPQISFQVRIRATASLDEISKRVSRALNIRFQPSSHKEFDGDEALEAEALGLWIVLSYWPIVPETQERTYFVRGLVSDELDTDWDTDMLDFPVISIGPYIQHLLTLRDGPGWFIPTEQDLLEDAGLTDETTS